MRDSAFGSIANDDKVLPGVFAIQSRTLSGLMSASMSAGRIPAGRMSQIRGRMSRFGETRRQRGSSLLN